MKLVFSLPLLLAMVTARPLGQHRACDLNDNTFRVYSGNDCSDEGAWSEFSVDEAAASSTNGDFGKSVRLNTRCGYDSLISLANNADDVNAELVALLHGPSSCVAFDTTKFISVEVKNRARSRALVSQKKGLVSGLFARDVKQRLQPSEGPCPECEISPLLTASPEYDVEEKDIPSLDLEKRADDEDDWEDIEKKKKRQYIDGDADDESEEAKLAFPSYGDNSLYERTAGAPIERIRFHTWPGAGNAANKKRSEDGDADDESEDAKLAFPSYGDNSLYERTAGAPIERIRFHTWPGAGNAANKKRSEDGDADDELEPDELRKRQYIDGDADDESEEAKLAFPSYGDNSLYERTAGAPIERIRFHTWPGAGNAANKKRSEDGDADDELEPDELRKRQYIDGDADDESEDTKLAFPSYGDNSLYERTAGAPIERIRFHTWPGAGNAANKKRSEDGDADDELEPDELRKRQYIDGDADDESEEAKLAFPSYGDNSLYERTAGAPIERIRFHTWPGAGNAANKKRSEDGDADDELEPDELRKRQYIDGDADDESEEAKIAFPSYGDNSLYERTAGAPIERIRFHTSPGAGNAGNKKRSEDGDADDELDPEDLKKRFQDRDGELGQRSTSFRRKRYNTV